MLFTHVQQDCTSVPQSDGSTVYDITSAVIDAGELPHSNIFVFTISDVIDISRDAFTRVANPYDIEHVAQARDTAVANSETLYLTSIMYRRYTDLQIAVEAKAAIKSRIDNCVNSWVTYKNAFRGSLEILHPTAEPTYEQQLQDAYVAARTARVAAEAAITAASAAVDVARTAATDAAEISDLYKAEVQYCAGVSTIGSGTWYMYDLALGTIAGVTGLLPSANIFLAATKTQFGALATHYSSPPVTVVYQPSGAPAGMPSYFSSLLASIQTYDGAVANFIQNSAAYRAQFVAAQAAFCTNASTKYGAKVVVAAQKNAALATAIQAKQEADASLTQAENAEAAALAAVRAVCPDFDPNSI